LSVPSFVAWSGATLFESCWRLFRLKKRPPITRQLLALIGVPIELNDRKAREELGYVGRMIRKTGLDELKKTKG
jgi:hypothetical protein